jgi:hypothetical protein
MAWRAFIDGLHRAAGVTLWALRMAREPESRGSCRPSLSADGSDYDREQFLSGAATAVLFTSAALNFGVNQLIDVLVELAPPPSGALDVDGARQGGRARDAGSCAQEVVGAQSKS